ncbi:ABC transporter ATP-binding protein [Corallococcus llansteffanensis]|uniref:ATP-binding cassette domain-containing protein n=1 Tax=Corallococcus llansteffanensis TaxID=2316731 RepID=A0A3A8Q2R5_9BACT|nr:ABC transporter transmembrane domain-containing protein [Corallococcus llansteffanensis]RKH60355.1 ATP-binding cassette domain-containing protein [Corallococcus llansteffanensis]
MSDEQAVPRPGELPRQLWRLIRPERRRLVAATGFLVLGSAMGLVYPQAIRVIIDVALQRGSQSWVDAAALGMLAVFAVQGVAIGFRHVLFNVAGERVVARLRESLFRHLLQQEVALFDALRTGELASRLSQDVARLSGSIGQNLAGALGNVLTTLGGLALLLHTSPALTVWMLAVVPPVAFGGMAYGRRMQRTSREVQDALARAQAVAEEALVGVRTVRSFVAEETEARRYAEALRHALDLARRGAVAMGSFMALGSFAGFAAAAAVLWRGGRMVVAGELTAGALMSFLVYTLLVAFSLGALSDAWAEFMRAAGAAARVFELLDRRPAMAPEGGRVPASARGHVHLEGVRFTYASRPEAEVLRGLDLTLAPGERVALVGPSGSGKSTVAALLGRLYDPDAGRVLLDGQDVRDLDPRWLRRQVGTVSQEPLLFSGTVADNIRYARPDASLEEVEAAARAANAHDFITRFPEGYATRVGERGAQLSGGQKQRIAIARAVLKDPRILVLDEATSALDAESEHLVQEALDRLMQGRTTLVIAHRLSTVRGADRVLVLEGGAVVQSGDHASLLGQDGLYRRLVERQALAL